jgi:hypothetical protein
VERQKRRREQDAETIVEHSGRQLYVIDAIRRHGVILGLGGREP